MNIGGGQIRGALFNCFVVKKFCFSFLNLELMRKVSNFLLLHEKIRYIKKRKNIFPRFISGLN